MKLANVVRKRTIAMLLVIALVLNLLPAQQIKADTAIKLAGEGTEESPYLIGSEQDWETFATIINDGKLENQYYRLTEDISVTGKENMVGTQEHKFSGVFDGNSHVIKVDITDNDNHATALFRCIGGATIKNLTVTGRVEGTLHCAGLAGFAWDGTTNEIKNCWVQTNVFCNGGSHSHAGGILGHGKASTTTISDCLFTGSIANATTKTGVIYGWSDEGQHKIINCLADPSELKDCKGVDLMTGNKVQTVENCYKTKKFGNMGTYTNNTGEALRKQLGDGWIVEDDKVLPKMESAENYLIKINDAKYGSISVSAPKEVYKYKDKIVLEPKPEEGYRFNGVKVKTIPESVSNNESGEVVNVSGGNTWYTFDKENLPNFKMPRANVEITPVFVSENELYLEVPHSGNLEVKLPIPKAAIHIYDDGGKNGSYGSDSSGTLTLKAPEGYYPSVTGNVNTLDDDVLTIIRGENVTESQKEEYSGNKEITDSLVSDSDTMVLQFESDGNGTKTSGFDLTLTLASGEDIIAEGSCGAQAKWSLTRAGKLKISGSGDMDSISKNGVFWKKYVEKIKTAEIEAGITKISENAFADHNALTDLYLGHTWAESRKIGLKAANIPENCEIHYYDNPLSTLTLPENMEIVKDAEDKWKDGNKYKPEAVIAFSVKQYYKAENVKANGTELTPDEGVYTINMEDKDVVVTADVEHIRYAIKYVVEEDVDNTANTDKIDAGTPLYLNDPKREGYIFKGWYTDEECKTLWTQGTVPTEDLTFYPRWIKILTYDEACYLTLPRNMIIVEDAEKDMKVSEKYKPGAVIKVAVEENYTAKNVKMNDEAVEPDEKGVYTFIMGEKDVVVTADISTTEFPVIYMVDEDVDNKDNPGSVLIGQKLNLTDPEKEGFVFKGWFTDENLKEAWNANQQIYQKVVLYAKWVKPYIYIDENGNEQTCDEYEILTDETRDMIGSENGPKGWYVVEHDVTIPEQLVVASKTVKLLLCDGVTLKAEKGIKVAKGTTSDWSGVETTISIYGQKEGTGTLIATGADGFAGIGGSNGNHGCHVNIYGGIIHATGDTNASGLGGGGSRCDVNIYGGQVTANGGENGYGIGGTNEATKCIITLSGGSVSTDSVMGTVTIPEGRYFVTEDGAVLKGTLSELQIQEFVSKPSFCAYRVGFNTVGGSKLPALYNHKDELLELKEVPVKEGMALAGWYKDAAYTEEWNMEEDRVTGDIVLYAKWAKPLDESKVEVDTNCGYNGEEQLPAVMYDGEYLTYDKDYTIGVEGEHKNAGTYTAKITFIGEYTGEISREFKIDRKKLEITSVSVKDKNYDGTLQATIEKIDFDGGLEEDDVTIESATATYDSAKAGNKKKVTAKDFTISGEDADNYTVKAEQFETEGTILPRPVSIKALDQSVSANSMIETGASKTEVTAGSYAEGEKINDILLTAAIGSSRPGTAPIYPAEAKICDQDGNDTTENYEITYIPGWIKVAKGPAKIKKAPVANDLTYTGGDLELVKEGQAEGGTFVYRLGEGEFSEKIPTAREEGTYTVRYKVVGDEDHIDLASEEYRLDVTIKKAETQDEPGITDPKPAPGTDVKKPSLAKAEGTVLTLADGTAEYVVTSKSGETPAVTFRKLLKAVKKVNIPAEVTFDNVNYQVTGIAPKAFANNKALTNVTIGINVTTIGKEIFKGCKKLKSINVKTTKLTAKSVKSKAFKGIKNTVKVKVPKSKKADYKKLFQKKGLSKDVKIK
ncbi:MAG: hypothetical protein E7294_09875 [Lachnospiraceae bacterium]|nr:hypothetical protein [Lachnospiraceae bacterium]